MSLLIVMIFNYPFLGLAFIVKNLNTINLMIYKKYLQKNHA
jgi:hypothetical protein